MAVQGKTDWGAGKSGRVTPTHYCAACLTVTGPNLWSCHTCHTPRPDGGWPPLNGIPDPFLGRILDDRYLIVQRLAVGPGSIVYRGKSLTINREFAVKVVDTEAMTLSVTTEDVRKRLDREIRALSRLRTPHVVPIYEILDFNKRAVGLVMDLVPGETLQRIVDRSGPLDLVLVVEIMRQLANGLDEAHRADMVHRDLKPSNIMIDRLPLGDPYVQILDFGIVHCQSDVRTTQGFLGTPAYASPEQIKGDVVTPASDFYSLGALLFFMLTGRPPFEDGNTYRLMFRHVHELPPLISQVPPKREYPAQLVDLVDCLLAKRASARPESLQAIVAKLEPIRWTRPSTSYRWTFDASTPRTDSEPSTALELEVEVEASQRRTQDPTAPVPTDSQQRSPRFDTADWMAPDSTVETSAAAILKRPTRRRKK